MSVRQNLNDFKDGFHPTFWVANGMELFERLALYGQATIQSIFLRDHLHLTAVEAGQLSSIFGGLIYMLPIFAGTLADKFGFRKAFAVAFFILSIGYFLIGSVGMEAFQGIYAGLPLFWVVAVIFVFTAMGGSFIKPAVLGTIAVTSKPETKSLGYAIYYWLVNIGAGTGPVIAYFVRDSLGIQYVYLVSSASCLLMFFVNLFCYKEVKTEATADVESLGTKMKNLVVVLENFKFMSFLLIFSLFWIMFWQTFIIVPYYVKDYISLHAPFEIIESMGAWGIIALQLIVNRLTKHCSTRRAIVAGFATSSLCWIIIALHPTIWTIIAGIVVFSIGEMTQAPRYYEYISDIAPKGQQGLYQGYAFLPIAIAWFVGGPFGGFLYSEFAGSPLLSPKEITSCSSLVKKLKDANEQSPLSLYLKQNFSQEARNKLEVYNGPAQLAPEHEKEWKQTLMRELGYLMQSQSIYQKERFANITLAAETQKRLAQNPQGPNLIRLNRLLLEDAYPLELAKNPAAFKTSDPNIVWLVIFCIGVLATLLMFIYNKVVAA
jgi:dipeptide/tripeptide permease